jgi:O-antigen/teichoic acid export membrane protein
MLNFLINKYKNRSDFTKNFLVLFRGTLIAQIIPVLLAPVLTRMYSPDDFGVFELFLSVTLILGAIANGRYELAVVLPDKQEDAWNIVGLGAIVSFVFSLFLLLIVSFFANDIALLLNNADIELWLILVPIAVLFQGWHGLMNYFNTREKTFKTIATANVARASSRTGLQVLIGVIVKSPAGLIVGQVAGFFVGLLVMFRKQNFKKVLKIISLKEMRFQGKRYRRFPLFTMPSTLVNSAAVNMTGILISVMYSISSVGFYSLANRILGMPGTLIGKSLSNVYHKEAVDELKKYGHAKRVFLSTLKKLLLISFPLYFLIFLFAEDLFTIVFGDEWAVAGQYAKLLIPLWFIRLVTAPISVSLSVFEKQNISLYWQLGLLFLSILVFVLALLFSWSIQVFLLCFVLTLFFYYSFFIFILWKVVKNNR